MSLKARLITLFVIAFGACIILNGPQILVYLIAQADLRHFHRHVPEERARNHCKAKSGRDGNGIISENVHLQTAFSVKMWFTTLEVR